MRLIFTFLILLCLRANSQVAFTFTDQPFLQTATSGSFDPSQIGGLFMRFKATDLSAGSVSLWTDTVQGRTLTNNTASARPTKASGSTSGVYFDKANSQMLYMNPVVTSLNEFSFYWIVKVTNAPSGVYFGLSDTTGSSASIGLHPSLWYGNAGVNRWGYLTLGQLMCFVASESATLAQRYGYTNGVSNGNGNPSSQFQLLITQVGAMQGFTYPMQGYLYEYGVFTNVHVSATDALNLYKYATNTYQ